MEKRLFIFVEGADDIRFFGRLVKPLLVPRYRSVELIAYASMKREKVSRFIKSLNALGHEYIFVGDIDFEPSVESKKYLLTGRYQELAGDHIVVVIREIESWYLAGLDRSAEARLGVRHLELTNTVTKEDFVKMIPRRFVSKVDFMFEILKFFSLESAEEKNRSFRFFVRKYQIPVGTGTFPDTPRPETAGKSP
ncbi:MAG: hypothetical protein ABFC24_01375 [Methanoregulaceae archaeon]